MIKQLCDWIEANSSFDLGDTLQVGHRIQGAPDRCVVVQETAGGDSNFYQPDIEWLQIQVVARGKTYLNARDDARTIHDLLNGASGIEIGTSPNLFAITITAVAPPQYVGQDDTRRFEFSTNYRIAIYDRAAI